jgi:protein TonB
MRNRPFAVFPKTPAETDVPDAGSRRAGLYFMSTQDSATTRLIWMGIALLLHGALLFAMPKGETEMPRFPAPIQVSLLDPAPAQAPRSAQAEPEPEPAPPQPEPPKPEPPKPEPPKPKPGPKPKPKPVAQPVVTETPVPLADIPVADPVPAAAPEPESAVPAGGVQTASAAPVGGTRTVSGAPGGDPHGDAAVEARFDAAYLRNPKPLYPPMSKKLREEGKVMLRVYVLANGSAGKVEIKQSSGSARLDEAARSAVTQWRFVPARRRNEAVDAWVVVPISFNLEEFRHRSSRDREHRHHWSASHVRPLARMASPVSFTWSLDS